MPRRATRGSSALLLGAGLALASVLPAGAQEPVPSPTPSPPLRDRLTQDELDFQGRSSVVLGSGARAVGMGGAFLARADDATAASWNPAGLSYLRRPEVSAVWARDSFTNDTRTVEADLERVTFTDRLRGHAPDFLAAAYPLEIGSVSGAVQLSFQRVFSFTHKRDIERVDVPPLQLEGEGGFDVLALGAGLQLSRTIRIGATVNRWFNGFHQVRERLQRRRTLQEVDFDLSGWNVNFGTIWTPIESLNLGAVAKTPFTAKVRLARERTDFFSVTNAPDIVSTNAFASDDVRLDLPGALGVGVSWRPRSPLTLSVDYTRTFWSNGRIRSYFTLPRTEPGQPPPTPTAPENVFETLRYPTLEDPVQKDTEQLRVGVEYVFIRGRVKFPIRAGYFNDRQHFQTGQGKTPRFHGFTVGTGILIGPVLIDVAYVLESGNYREVTDEAEARTSVRFRRLLVSMIYRHGASR